MLVVNRRYLAAFAAVFALLLSVLIGPSVHAADAELVTARGQVTGLDGAKLEGVLVEFQVCEEDFILGLTCFTGRSGTTGADGEFEIQVDADQVYRISFEGDDEYAVQYWSGAGETVESREDAVEVVFVQDGNAEIDVELAKGASIRGLVKDIAGQPADGVSIEVFDENDNSVKQGMQQEGEPFKLGGLPAGSYVVHFSLGDFTAARSVDLSRSETKDLGAVQFTADQIQNTSPPTVEGYTFVGSTLTVDPGAWSVPTPVFAFRWFADGELIVGQTAATLVVPRAAADKQIRVEVTASKPGFPASDTIESAPTDPISFEQIEVVTNPSVSGTPAVGATLTAQPGVWNPADVDLEYQWSVDGVEINGATGVTFVPQEAHAGKSVMVEVTASKLDFESAQATSAPTSPLTIITLTNTAPPVISGTPTVGATLTATVGGWSASQGTWNQSGATITYTWYQGETEVSSGTSNTYVVPASAVGKAIVVTVTISKPGYRTTGIVVSAPTGIVPVPAVANVVNPSVVGVPVVGGVLTARPGAWSESGVTYSYRWFANGVAIAGATGSAYKVPVAHLGKQITVGVSASKTGFVKSVEARSVATAKVGYASSVAVKTKNKKKRKVEFKVTVKSNRKAVRGKVAVYRGNTLVKSGNLNKKGKVTIKLSKQPAGKHTYSIRYLGSGHAKPVSKNVGLTTKK